ncbi:MAG: alpha/beta hydrolase [Paracoccaceae bacterium]|nr:alpha/beta hydrolase [Paracoccaceae bacterium]MDG2257920.1 alpha/beta hydrolase [Paracoccaceae bacterium]
MAEFFDTSSDRRIAFHRTKGKGPGVVFLGGFMSDMEGSKATHLEDWAKRQGRAFLRFDYSGHGQSSEAFAEGSIGDWFADAREVIEQLTDGPQVLVGSSMGGWISLLCAKSIPDRIAGMVTIAAAPDFTENGFFAGFSAAEKAQLETEGVVLVPSDYGEPYPITKRLIEDGRDHLVMNDPLSFDFPIRMLQGTKDSAVTRATALGLLDHLDATDVRLSFVAGGDHSLSTPDNLRMIVQAIEDVLTRV